MTSYAEIATKNWQFIQVNNTPFTIHSKSGDNLITFVASDTPITVNELGVLDIDVKRGIDLQNGSLITDGIIPTNFLYYKSLTEQDAEFVCLR